MTLTRRDWLAHAAAAPIALASARSRTPADGAVTLLVTRHCEKGSNDPKDPDLSEAGRARAAALATLLGHAGVSHLFASEWKRTQQTLAPIAQSHHLTTAVASAADLETLATKLLALPAGAVALIAGHSNTVPALVRRLGGTITGSGDGLAHDGKNELLPDDEFGRLMVLVLPAPGAAERSALVALDLRYGA